MKMRRRPMFSQTTSQTLTRPSNRKLQLWQTLYVNPIKYDIKLERCSHVWKIMGNLPNLITFLRIWLKTVSKNTASNTGIYNQPIQTIYNFVHFCIIHFSHSFLTQTFYAQISFKLFAAFSKYFETKQIENVKQVKVHVIVGWCKFWRRY